MVDGHPYKVEVVGSSPTVPTTTLKFQSLQAYLKTRFQF